MREIKIEYIIKLDTRVGEYFSRTIYTLEEIEKRQFTHHESLVVAKRQYTGLKDKNDVEIYEGDILETHKVKLGTKFESIKYKVFFYDAYYHIQSNNYMQPLRSIDVVDMELEVIGNIYENQELLETA